MSEARAAEDVQRAKDEFWNPSFGYRTDLSQVGVAPAVGTGRDQRKAAALAWKALPSRTRREVFRYGRQGKLHPDPHVQDVSRQWATLQRGSLLSTAGVILLFALSVVSWGRVFSLPAQWILIALGLSALLVLTTVTMLWGVIRTARDPASPIATSEDQGEDRVAGFRPAWFLRVAAMVIGFTAGPLSLLAGIVVILQGDGVVVPMIVGLVGLGLLVAAVRSAQVNWRTWRGGPRH